MAQTAICSLPGLMKFYTKEELRKYLEELAGYYQVQVDLFGEKLGTLMRSGQEKGGDEKKQNGQMNSKLIPKGWVRMGTLLVSLSNSVSTMTEVSLQLHEEFKAKLARTTDALKSFDEGAGSVVPANSTYYLYMKNGIPERILVEAQEARREDFQFSAQFQLV